MSGVSVEAVAREGPRQCPYCRGGIAALESAWTCPSCETPHHRDCARQNGRCTVFACSGVVSIEVRIPKKPAWRAGSLLVAELGVLPSCAFLLFAGWGFFFHTVWTGLGAVLGVAGLALLIVALVLPVIALERRHRDSVPRTPS